MDVFTNPNTDTLLQMLNVDEAIVYGVATEYCVKSAVMGLLTRGIKVKIVDSAIKGINEENVYQSIKDMKYVGAEFISLEEALK